GAGRPPTSAGGRNAGSAAGLHPGGAGSLSPQSASVPRRAAVADRRSIALSSRPEQGSALVRVESVSSRRSNGDVRIGHVVGNAGALAQIIKIDGHWEAASPGRAIKARKLFRVGLQLATGETLIVDHVILEEAAHGQISLPFRGWRSPVEPGDA